MIFSKKPWKIHLNGVSRSVSFPDIHILCGQHGGQMAVRFHRGCIEQKDNGKFTPEEMSACLDWLGFTVSELRWRAENAVEGPL
jgi:hypothetical protein